MTEKFTPLDAAQCVLDDLKLLQAGEWETDADSCQCSIDNMEMVIADMKAIRVALENALVVIVGEYPKNDERYVDAMSAAEKFGIDLGEMA